MTLQEFFVAQHVEDHHLLDTLLEHTSDPWWEEVLLLYSGKTSDASMLLQKLVGQSNEVSSREDIFHSRLLLAGRCIAARPTIRQSFLRESVLSDLFSILIHTPYSLTQSQTANVLAEIGGGEVNTQLLRLLSDEQLASSGSVRASIAQALATIGDRSVVPELLRLLSDEQLDSLDMIGRRSSVRVSIAQALEKLADDELTVSALAALLPSSDIKDAIFSTLWTVSHSASVRAFIIDGQAGQQIEIVKIAKGDV